MYACVDCWARVPDELRAELRAATRRRRRRLEGVWPQYRTTVGRVIKWLADHRPSVEPSP